MIVAGAYFLSGEEGKDTFNELVAITRPNFLSKYLGSENLTDTDRDSYRAKVIRQKISN